MEKRKLSEVTELIKRGVTPKYVENNGITVINQKCIRDNRIDFTFARQTSKDKKVTEEKVLMEGDILINSTGTGTLGRTAQINQVNESMTVDTHVTIVRPKKDINHKFLGYFIRLNEPLITSMGKGATNQIELSASDLGNIDITLQSRKQQDKIVDILYAYDDLIENNLKRINLLEETAESIYREWFVNFRFPGYEKCEVVNSIPDKWKVGKVSDIAVLDSGYAFKSKDFQEQGNPIIKIKNIENNSINTMDCDCVEKSIVEKLSKFKLECGDLLIAMTGATVGKIGIMPRTQKDYYLNQRVGRIKSKYDFDISSYIFCLFNSNFISNSIINIAKGAAQPNISTVEIGNIEILLPEQNVLYDFEKCCSYLLKSRLNLIEQNEKLKEARDILLPKLIMGEIEV